MDAVPTRSSLQELLKLAELHPLVVSIYIPTHQASTSQSLNEDRARFKNSLQESESELEEKGARQQQVGAILDKARQLYEDMDFWLHRGQALAVFLAPDTIKWYRLPVETDELVYTGKRFVLAPLAVAANMPGYHYVLKLDLKSPKLFLASWQEFEEIKIKDMPGRMDEALNISGYEQEQQYQGLGNRRNGTQGRGDAVYHGHGGAKDNRDSMVENYLRMVDSAVGPSRLEHSDAPFIIAGNAEHAAAFKSISHRRIDHVINKETAGEEELRQRVMEYLNNQLELGAEEFAAETYSEDSSVQEYSWSKLEEMAGRGQIKHLGVGMLSATRDSVRDVKHRITKLDLSMDKHWLRQVERLIHKVIGNGGEITGTFIKDGRRGLQAILRYKA